jgi:hypothetical protein
MKVLGWETQREAVMSIFYILGIIAIVIFVLKVIILFLKNSGNENILENGENKDDNSNEGSDENNNDKLFFE